MKDLNELVEQTLRNLAEKNIPATPENYEKEFYKSSKKNHILIEEQFEFDDIVNSLCKKEKEMFDEFSFQSFKKLSLILSKRISPHKIKQFLLDLSYLMSPSLCDNIKKEIDEICIEMVNNPNSLMDTGNTRKLRKLSDLRIKNDKSLFNEKNTDLTKVIDFLGDFFTRNIKENCITIDKIIDIRNEIKDLNLSVSSSSKLSELNDRLLSIIDRFEKTVDDNNKSIIEANDDKESLKDQIDRLKVSLNKAEEEKSLDFLTGVKTRRAYSIDIKRVENEYNIFDSNYAIIFYDLDYFKKINDTYGHDCGDSVLATFSSILSKLTRSEDIICRYGGEEFICIVHYKNTMEINNYLKRVKNIISNNKFVYNEIKLDIKFSAGVAFRNSYNSYEKALRSADSHLYKAKETGRDKIILDNGSVF